MFIFTEASISFAKRCASYAKKVISQEIGLQVNRSRFKFKNYMYPIRIQVFEHSKIIGRFYPSTYEIHINKNLMFASDSEIIWDTLRHELAHYFTYLLFGDQIHDHGLEFKEVCRNFGWGEKVWSAKLEQSEFEKAKQHSKKEGDILRKVEKLLKLGEDQSSFEAQSAIAKANQLLVKYNLSLTTPEDAIDFAMDRVYQQKRSSGKLNAIYEILTMFYVAPVLNYGKDCVYMEVSGRPENVEIAGYIANFLNVELDRLWSVARKENPKLKGITHKNSFMRGLAKAYCQKIRTTQKGEGVSSNYALLKIEKELDLAKKVVYGRIGGKSSYYKQDNFSRNIGELFGKNLNISQPLQGKKHERKQLDYNPKI